MSDSRLAAFASLLLLLGQGVSTLRPDPPITCTDCADWNAPREPYRVFGNTYYVGVKGLSAVLITSDGRADSARRRSAAISGR